MVRLSCSTPCAATRCRGSVRGGFATPETATRRDEEAKPHGTAMTVRWPKGTRDPRPGWEDGTLTRMRGPTGDLAHRLAVARGDEPPDEFARAALPWGTTTAVLDPHEIANVFGLEGVRALLKACRGIPFDFFVMVSSCVPASPFESSGATVDAGDIARFLVEEPNALGLAEMMDFPAVVAGEEGTLAKIAASRGRHIDGHAPGLSGPALNAYIAAGVRSDHECTTLEEALEKRRLGMTIIIREGSAAQNLEALLPLVLEHGPAHCLLCTDDLEPDHLLEEGHINDVIRKAVALGCSPADAVTMGTLNAARYHRLYEHGAVAPGYVADVVAVEDLQRFHPVRVWKRGRLVAEEGKPLEVPRSPMPDWMRGSVRVPHLTAGSFRIEATGRSEEHTSELQSRPHLVCRLLLEKK